MMFEHNKSLSVTCIAMWQRFKRLRNNQVQLLDVVQNERTDTAKILRQTEIRCKADERQHASHNQPPTRDDHFQIQSSINCHPAHSHDVVNTLHDQLVQHTHCVETSIPNVTCHPTIHHSLQQKHTFSLGTLKNSCRRRISLLCGAINAGSVVLSLDVSSKTLVGIIREPLFRFPPDVPCPVEKVDILMRAGHDRVCAEGTAKEIEEFGPVGRRIGVLQDVLYQARALHHGALGVSCRLQKLSGHFSSVWTRLRKFQARCYP